MKMRAIEGVRTASGPVNVSADERESHPERSGRRLAPPAKRRPPCSPVEADLLRHDEEIAPGHGAGDLPGSLMFTENVKVSAGGTVSANGR